MTDIIYGDVKQYIEELRSDIRQIYVKLGRLSTLGYKTIRGC